MPGPAHRGIVYVDYWAPGPGTPGARQEVQLGGFSADMVLAKIVLETATEVSDWNSSHCSLQLQQAKSLALYDVFRRQPCKSWLFNPNTTCLMPSDLGVFLPAGAKLKFIVEHAGTDRCNWTFLWVQP